MNGHPWFWCGVSLCVGFVLGAACLLLLGLVLSARRQRKPHLTKTWRLRRVRGETVLFMDVGLGPTATSGPRVFLEIQLPRSLGHRAWKSYVEWMDWLADRTHGKVRLVELKAHAAENEVSQD